MDPLTQSRQSPQALYDVRAWGWRFCATENRWVRAAEAPRSPWEQAGTFLLQIAPWGLSYGYRETKGYVSADNHVLHPRGTELLIRAEGWRCPRCSVVPGAGGSGRYGRRTMGEGRGGQCPAATSAHS